MKRFAYLSTLALCLGGVAHAEEYETPPDESSVEALMGPQQLTPGLYSGRFLEPIKVRNCWYFISSETPSRTSAALLTVRRLATPHCEPASRILAWSFDTSGGLLATRKGDALVVGYSVKLWPQPLQGSIQLFHLSPDTLENLRPSNNVLLPTGGITASRLSFEGQNLVVQGSKVGTLPGERGSGSYYTATFERFLDSDAAPVVVAHPDAPPAEPTPTVGDSAYIPVEGMYQLPFKVKDCWYFATARAVVRGWNLAQLHLSRLPVNGCEGKTAAFEYSFDPSTFLVTTKGGSGIAIAWSVRTAPDFVPSVPTTLILYNISPDTLANLRTVNNRLSSSVAGGKVRATQLDFDGQRLVLQGTRDGVLLEGAPESGSGPNFTATYERFLDSDAPASVVAH